MAGQAPGVALSVRRRGSNSPPCLVQAIESKQRPGRLPHDGGGPEHLLGLLKGERVRPPPSLRTERRAKRIPARSAKLGPRRLRRIFSTHGATIALARQSGQPATDGGGHDLRKMRLTGTLQLHYDRIYGLVMERLMAVVPQRPEKINDD